MKSIVIMGMVLVLLLQGVVAWSFTEVMYDPVGSDANREWVEVYGPPLDGLFFVEDGGTHGLTLVSGFCESDCVSIVADDADAFLSEYVVDNFVLVYDSSWSSLKNTGEPIALNNGSVNLTAVVYPPIAQGGHSLHNDNGSWVSAPPDPGEVFVSVPTSVPEFGSLLALFVLIAGLLFMMRRRSIRLRSRPST